MSGRDRTRGSLPDRPRSRDDVVFRELADEWVLFDPVRQRLHVLNLTAAIVWAHCTGEHAVDEIAERVADAFDDAPTADSVAEEVRDALHTFAGEELLTETEEDLIPDGDEELLPDAEEDGGR